METYFSLLGEDNPWWNGNILPPEIGLDRRLPYEQFKDLALNQKNRRSIVLLGQRRVGKTVMLKQLIGDAVTKGIVVPRNVCFASMDKALLSGVLPSELTREFRTKTDPGKPCLIVLDEIQKCEDWQSELKSLTDNQRDCKFVVACSVAPALKRISAESGQGRFLKCNLPPLSFHEFCWFRGGWKENLPDTASGVRSARLGKDEVGLLNGLFLDYLNFGSYPEATFDDGFTSDQNFGFNILDDDLFTKYAVDCGISPDNRLLPLLRHIAESDAQEISLENLASNTKVRIATLYKYLEYLKAAFLIRQVAKYDANMKDMGKNPGYKFVLESPSMHRAFTGRTRLDGRKAGHRVEAAVISQHQVLNCRSKNYVAEKVRFCRFTNHYKERKVDMVHANLVREVIRLAEIKWSDKPSILDGARRNLEFFHRKHKKAENYEGAFCTTKSTYHETKDRVVTFLPTSQYCLSLGMDCLEKAPKLQIHSQARQRGKGTFADH